MPTPEPPPAAGQPPANRPAINLDGFTEFDALIVRTDISDDAAWTAILEGLKAPVDGDIPQIFVSADPVWAGAHPDEIVAALPQDIAPSVVFIADSMAMAEDPPTLLAVDTDRLLRAGDYDDLPNDAPDRFRVSLETVYYMTINLAVGNADFDDFENYDEL